MSWFSRGRLWAALGAFVLASCGGGGGGGGGTEPSLSVTADRSSLQFVGFTSAPPVSQTVRFTLHNSAAGTYYGSVVIDQPNTFGATFTPTSSTTADVTLTPIHSTQPGTHSGSLTFRLCNDISCNRVAWSTTMPYTITVYGVDTTTIAFNGFEGAAAATHSIAVTPPDTSGQIVATTSTASNAAWLSVSHGNGDSIDVSARGSAVSPGNYQGQVTLAIAGQSGGPMLTIPVGFTVGTGIVAPAPAPVDVIYDSTFTSLKRQLPVAFNGAQSPAWTTTTSGEPWLVLTQGAGTGAGAIEFTIDPSRLQAVGNWQSATARVTIQAGVLTPATFDITVNKKLPELHMTSPNTVVAGRANQVVRVFGRGLSQLPGVAWILLDNQPASGAIVSDTLAQLTLPTLPAGRVTLRVPNLVSTDVSEAAVVAAPLGALAYATTTNAGEKRSALFDPSRNAVYAVNATQNALVRYRLVGGQWTVDGVPVSQIGDLAMSPDRSTLYVGSGATQLLAIDPDTLQVKTTFTPPANFASMSPLRSTTPGMAVTNDLRLWFNDGQGNGAPYFDIGRRTFGTLVPDVGALYSPVFFAPADGSRLVLALYGSSPTPAPVWYSAPSSSFISTPSLPGVYSTTELSEDGSRLLVDGTWLYDGDNAVVPIGTLDTGNALRLNNVVSPDGRRIYTLVAQDENASVAEHIEVFDTTQVVSGSSMLVKIGQIPLPDLAADCASPSLCNLGGTLLISPLGDTLFWVGNQRLVVLPVPQALSGINAARRLLPAQVR